MQRSNLKLVVAATVTTTFLGMSAGTAAAQDPDGPSIAEVVSTNPNLVTVALALEQTPLADMFTDCEAGDLYTVFAPTDDALTDASAWGFDAAAASSDVELLTSILSYHVIEGAYSADALLALDSESTATANGETLTVVVAGDEISLVSAAPKPANVVGTDLQACNGIVHVIDNVLLPPTAATALGIEATDDDETAGAPELASTGPYSSSIALLALTLLAAGGLALAASRRRGPQPNQTR